MQRQFSLLAFKETAVILFHEGQYLTVFFLFFSSILRPGPITPRSSAQSVAKRYVSEATMRRHYFTHSGKYPYPCPQCDRGFLTPRDMKEHLTSHTNIFYFNCDVCKQSFRSYFLLKRHRKQEHQL